MQFLTTLAIGVICCNGLVSAYSDPAVMPVVNRRDLNETTLNTILEDIETASTCSDCQTILKLLKEVAEEGDDTFAELLTDYCVYTGEGTEDVCEGLMSRESHSMAHSLRQMEIPSHTSKTFCQILFGLCDPGILSYSVSFQKSKSKATRPSPSQKTPLKVVHISDIHVDLSYVAGASYNCTEMVCCRIYSDDDAPNVTDYPAGAFGNPNCDSPLALEKSMYAKIRQVVPDAALTLFTGDIVEGAEDLTTNSEIVTDINDAYTQMLGLNHVYGAIGNHESNPVNSFPPSGVDAGNYSSQYVYNTLSDDWKRWIGASAAKVASTNYGSYSVKHTGTNLRIISINTMFWMKENFWIYQKTMPRDPSGHFAWLAKELASAESAGERVYIIGHIPPGRSDILSDYSEYFDQVVQRYSATIAALFWGHTHKDMFEISYTTPASPSVKSATAISYIAPAMVPSSGNPTFRVYSVDPVTFAVLDYTVYIANMSAPTYQHSPVWEKYYSAKEAYGKHLSPPVTGTHVEMTPGFWHRVTQLFENNDEIFQEWYARKTRGYDVEDCDDDCKSDEICQMRAAQAQYNCIDANTPISIKKRGLKGGPHVETGECPGSRAIEVMRSLGAEGVRQYLVKREA
ncbi:MAG: hypothetical protein M1834_008027 [Cirrosporium novae-zelandiae]|nr:MAG: hypothetical protein M1834_008027 [Cirrosporium novae-zelandiae]